MQLLDFSYIVVSQNCVYDTTAAKLYQAQNHLEGLFEHGGQEFAFIPSCQV